MVVPHDRRGILVDGFACEEETLGQAPLVAFGGLSASAEIPLAVAGSVSRVIRRVALVLQRRCYLFERLLAVGVMVRLKLNLAVGELDKILLSIALDLDVVAHRAEDIFEDSESQLRWQTEETRLCVQK